MAHIAGTLALMLALGSPGRSFYSVSDACGDDGVRSACYFSAAHGREVRLETRDEAAARYATIAESMSRVTEAATRADASPRWPGTPDELVAMIATVTRHESGWRLDVHSGVGPWAAGDCRRASDGGRLTEAEEKSPKVRRRCASWCLGQINTGGPDKRMFGWTGRELVGVDAERTDRCLGAVAAALVQVRGGRVSFDWPAVTLLRYGGGGKTSDEWVQVRVATFRRFLTAAPTDESMRLLGMSAGAARAEIQAAP